MQDLVMYAEKIAKNARITMSVGQGAVPFPLSITRCSAANFAMMSSKIRSSENHLDTMNLNLGNVDQEKLCGEFLFYSGVSSAA